VLLFSSKSANRLKLLYWDGNGPVMACKRLDEHVFTWPATRHCVMALDHAQFEAYFPVLTGGKCERLRRARRLRQTEPPNRFGVCMRVDFGNSVA
jgi:transposase